MCTVESPTVYKENECDYTLNSDSFIDIVVDFKLNVI